MVRQWRESGCCLASIKRPNVLSLNLIQFAVIPGRRRPAAVLEREPVKLMQVKPINRRRSQRQTGSEEIVLSRARSALRVKPLTARFSLKKQQPQRSTASYIKRFF
jgi:hypothetical protein